MVRTALVADIADHRRRDCLLVPAASRELRALIRVLQTRQRAVERQLSAWLESAGAAWQDRVQTHCLTCGVRVLSALQLCAYLPELGACNRRQIAKLAGLAPLPWDSGQLHGVRSIQHGRAPARPQRHLRPPCRSGPPRAEPRGQAAPCPLPHSFSLLSSAENKTIATPARN